MFRILSDTFFILFTNAKITKGYHICKYLTRKNLSYLQIYFVDSQ